MGSRKRLRTEKVSTLETQLSRHYTHHAIHRIAFAGLWKIVRERQSLLVIRCFTEVSCRGYPALVKALIDGMLPTGCGKFFEGTGEEMHTALNKTLATLPDDTKVYVSSFLDSYKQPADQPSLATSTRSPMLNLQSRFCRVSRSRSYRRSQRTTRRHKENSQLGMKRYDILSRGKA